MIEAEISSRQCTQSPNRFSHGNYFLVTHIFAEEAREVSVRARMRVRFQENTFRRLRRFIGAE